MSLIRKMYEIDPNRGFVVNAVSHLKGEEEIFAFFEELVEELRSDPSCSDPRSSALGHIEYVLSNFNSPDSQWRYFLPKLYTRR